MPKTYHISDEARVEIEEAKRKEKDVKLYKKLEVLSLRAAGMKNEKIKEITGYSENRICDFVSEYVKNGIGYFTCEHRKGGNRHNMTKEEENEFIKQFETEAEKGQIVTVEEIYKEYSKKYPNAVKATVYKILHRHGWRKVMPRSRHPKKASEEAMEASKKLT